VINIFWPFFKLHCLILVVITVNVFLCEFNCNRLKSTLVQYLPVLFPRCFSIMDESRCCVVEAVGMIVVVQPSLSRELYVTLSICLELDGVEVELLISHGNGASELPVTLARLDFQRSQLRFESRSDGSKDIDLVSHEITVSDTRYQGTL